MIYKVEVLENGTVTNASFMQVTHPNQVMKRITPFIKTQRTAIAVMNKKGDKWLYVVQKTQKGIQVRPEIVRQSATKREVELVFAGARPIFVNL